MTDFSSHEGLGMHDTPLLPRPAKSGRVRGARGAYATERSSGLRHSLALGGRCTRKPVGRGGRVGSVKVLGSTGEGSAPVRASLTSRRPMTPCR